MNEYGKFFLKWDNFGKNIANSFHTLRDDPDFSDVTLVCEEDRQIEAHRVILSGSSPFFNAVLKRNNHSHPMIYMRGLKFKDLTAIVDFIYQGEVSIHQEDLDGFLALSGELQLKGLAGADEERIEQKIEKVQSIQTSKQKKKSKILFKPEVSAQPVKEESKDLEDENESSLENQAIVQINSESMVVSSDEHNEDLNTKIESMMEKIAEGDFKWRCKMCGKETKGSKSNMTRHMESHIEGVSHSCSMCSKFSRSKSALKVHISTHHKK